MSVSVSSSAPTCFIQTRFSGPSAVCDQLTADLNNGMAKPAHAFKIGQQVYHHSGGQDRTQTGPYTIIGLLWQSGSAVRYCIQSNTRERIVDESELELALK